ncbi:MAG TPA: hypothetical protein VNV38_15110, partial [Stellaceae bacterium]|nr:hypothetical protein [Stellaceae bacterium]
MSETLPYGAWKSPITSDLIVAETIGLGGVIVDGNNIYWTESRPGEGGRNVLVRRTKDGGREDVTPAPLNVRTRVHEYGGGAVTVDRGIAYFSNFADQRLYRLAPGAAAEPLTPAPGDGARYRYADGVIDEARQRWIGVREAHSGERVDNTIVAVNFGAVGAGRVLVEGSDFCAAPRLSPDGKRLAWLQWNHPNMPWVGTELWVAEIAEDGGLGERRKIAGGDAESVAQPLWSPDGMLHFISDRSGWWNLYRGDDDGGAHSLCLREAEFCGAQWVFGQASYAFLSAGQIVCSYGEGAGSRLARLDTASGKLAPLDLPFCEFGSIKLCGGKIVCGAGSATGPGAIVVIDPDTRATEILRQSSTAAAEPELQRY